ncbi:MAG: YceI family protein [Ignavibacteria bacterium]|nr:YceI family protein [Ignavibacteria bacterium]MBL7990883.1 YceI family protein [Candidatus Kapabacteria bacterium]
MKRTLLATLVVAVTLGANAFAQTGKWALDRTHSQISFSVSHMVVAEAEGKFDSFDVAVLADKEDLTDAKVDVTIQVASVNTDNKDRDNHLKSADFFEAEKFPTITFKSKELKKVGDNKYKLVGDFTMHGVTKPVELDAKFGGVVKDGKGRLHAGFKVTGQVNRQDYGVKWSKKIDNNGLVVGDVVEFKGNVELVKQ